MSMERTSNVTFLDITCLIAFSSCSSSCWSSLDTQHVKLLPHQMPESKWKRKPSVLAKSRVSQFNISYVDIVLSTYGFSAEPQLQLSTCHIHHTSYPALSNAYSQRITHNFASVEAKGSTKQGNEGSELKAFFYLWFEIWSYQSFFCIRITSIAIKNSVHTAEGNRQKVLRVYCHFLSTTKSSNWRKINQISIVFFNHSLTLSFGCNTK